VNRSLRDFVTVFFLRFSSPIPLSYGHQGMTKRPRLADLRRRDLAASAGKLERALPLSET